MNTAAAGFSANEALEFMANKAGVTKEEIATAIIADASSQTAMYFKKLLTVGYDAITA